MVKQIRSALLVFLVLTFITGVVYPFFVTAVAWAFFPQQARGSLIVQGGKVVGSKLIGQSFDDKKYFWGRLSATGPMPYNASASSGSNLGPMNKLLEQNIQARAKALKDADPENNLPIPVDLITSSSSGLDPHISPQAAFYQASRVAKARGITNDEVEKLINKNTQGRLLGIIGEPVVNVLQLNWDLDKNG
jgi:K+-transporting ATPase ATPase C chain